MKLRIALVYISIFFCFQGIAQNSMPSIIQIDGVIVNKEDKRPVPFVHVLNLQSKSGTASNLEGRFSIQMQRQDSVIFSAIGFDKYLFMLDENSFGSRFDIVVEMNVNSFELETVDIFAYKDEYAFKNAILDLEVTNSKSNDRIELPGFYYGPRKEVKTSGSPLTFLYNKTSKRAKEERKFDLLESEYEGWKKKVTTNYNPTFVQGVTGLEEDKVEDFMRFCKLGDSFIRLSTQYEIVVAINKCLVKFQKDPEISISNDN